MRRKNNWKRFLCFVLAAVMLCSSVSIADAAGVKISVKERNEYFSKSAFIGNSISVGQKMYFNTQGKGFLGNPIVMARTSYSFMNDKRSNRPYMIQYKGVAYKAKDAIAISKVKRVFICMGTNDMYGSPDLVFQSYKEYLQGIRKKNPKVIIFIESMPPMCGGKKYLNNSAILKLNEKMKAYCEKTKDMYFIDIGKGLRDAKGALIRKYSSDGYVHLTMSGYKIWTDNVIAYVEKLLLQEKKADAAVKKAAKTRFAEDYNAAKELVNQLDKSTTKDGLKEKLKKIKVKKPKTKPIVDITEDAGDTEIPPDTETPGEPETQEKPEKPEKPAKPAKPAKPVGKIVTKNGKKYYQYENGKKEKSKFITVKGKTYYFGKDGAMEKGWMKKGSSYYYFDRSTGVQTKKGKVDGITIKNGTARKNDYSIKKIETMITAKGIMNKVTKATDSKSQKLKKVFDWVLKHPYKRHRILSHVKKNKGWEIIFANDIYKTGNGCCVSEACAFAFLAHECGYESYVCDDTGHAWTEIDGRVYDTLFAEAKSYKNYYNSSYKTAKLHRVGKLKI